jgi:hypothetical protein
MTLVTQKLLAETWVSHECPVGHLGNLAFPDCPEGRPRYQALLTLPDTWTASSMPGLRPLPSRHNVSLPQGCIVRGIKNKWDIGNPRHNVHGHIDQGHTITEKGGVGIHQNHYPSSQLICVQMFPEPEFLNFKEPKNRFQGTNSARLCSQAVRLENPIPTRFLAPVDYLKIPALVAGVCLAL